MGDAQNFDELLKGSVDDIKAKLGTLTGAQLDELHEAESNGGKRTTLLSAIDHEHTARDSHFAGVSRESFTGSGGATSGAESFTREQVDEMLAERDTAHQAALDQRDAEHATEIDELKGEAPMHTDEVIATAQANGAASLSALKGETSIQFFDRDGAAVDTLPAMTFGPRDFEPNGGQIMLMREVQFPVGLPERDVMGAMLFEGESGEGEPIGKAELVQPFGIGGGRPAKLPPRTLSFG